MLKTFKERNSHEDLTLLHDCAFSYQEEEEEEEEMSTHHLEIYNLRSSFESPHIQFVLPVQ